MPSKELLAGSRGRKKIPSAHTSQGAGAQKQRDAHELINAKEDEISHLFLSRASSHSLQLVNVCSFTAVLPPAAWCECVCLYGEMHF